MFRNKKRAACLAAVQQYYSSPAMMMERSEGKGYASIWQVGKGICILAVAANITDKTCPINLVEFVQNTKNYKI